MMTSWKPLRWSLGAAIGVVAAIMLFDGGPSGLAQDAKSKGPMEKVFPASSKCKRCHERAFEEWETSPLSRSIHSPVFRAALDAYLTSGSNKDKVLCLRCHAPHVNEYPDQGPAFIAQIKSG